MLKWRELANSRTQQQQQLAISRTRLLQVSSSLPLLSPRRSAAFIYTAAATPATSSIAWTWVPGLASVDVAVAAATAPNGIYILLNTFNQVVYPVQREG